MKTTKRKTKAQSEPKRRERPRQDSGVEEEPVSVNVENYVDGFEAPKNAPAQNEVPPKRKYTRRAGKSESGTGLGAFLRGLGAMTANITGSMIGSEAPLTKSEGDFLEYVGKCVSEVGDTSYLDEQIAGSGKWLIGGAFVVIAASRIIPAWRRRKQLAAPAQVNDSGPTEV